MFDLVYLVIGKFGENRLFVWLGCLVNLLTMILLDKLVNTHNRI